MIANSSTLQGGLKALLVFISATIPAAFALTSIDFEGPEYINGQTIVGVNDSAVSNSATWQYSAGTNISSAMLASTARPAAGSIKNLRITDNSASQAYTTYLDVSSELRSMEKFTVNLSLALGGAHAATGTQQAQIQLGRAPGSGWNDIKSWLNMDVDGNNVRLFVYDPGTAENRKPVVLAQHNGAYVQVSVEIDPVEKKYTKVVINGADVTAVVQTQNAAQLPWKPSVAGDPNFLLWITTGTDDMVTLDVDNIQFAQTWTAIADAEWISYIQASTNIKVAAGSALDFSNLHPSSPSIDQRGFAFVGRDGDLAFLDGTKARLFCAAENMEWLPFNIHSDTELDAYIAQLKRAGYNCFRPHFLDHFLMAGSTADLTLNNTNYAAWQKLVKRLKDNGIYLLIDATTSWCSFYSVSDTSSATAKLKRLKSRVYWDQAVRNHWVAAVTKIYTDINPYTGTALKDDPQVVANFLRNEPGLVFQLQNDNESSPLLAQEPGLRNEWIAWLATVQTHYANVAALNAAWSTSFASYADVPIPSPVLDAANTVKFRDLQKFAVYLEHATFQWLFQKFTGLGIKSLVLDYNADPSLPASFTRDVQAAVDLHTYHDHGYPAPAQGYYWRHHNQSSFDDSLSYIRLAAQSRIWGRTFMISEWGHVYWNPWRHEGGLVFPSYARLQGWSLIAQHGHPIAIAPKATDCFSIYEDPPTKAAERMSALLYGRGDVATSGNRVEAIIRPTDANYANAIGIGWPLMPAALLTRLGTRVDWPAIIRDDFDGSSLATLTERNDSTVPSSFWNASLPGNSANSVVTTTSGMLALKAADTPYPSSAAWGGSSSSQAFNFFKNQVVFSASGLDFDAASTVPADKQILRFALTSNVNLTYGAPDCITLEINAANKVVLGYKIDATTGASLNVVESITDIATAFGAISGFTLNPCATDLNELSPSLPREPAYDLVIYYRRSGANTPAYKRFTGVWKKQASFPALDVAKWGAAGNSLVQFEAQKMDGVSGTWVKAVVGEFRVGATASGPVGTDNLAPASFSQTVPATPATLTFENVVASLRGSGVLSGSNRTEAASTGSHNGTYHSDTEELFFKPIGREFQVVTARSEGGTLPSSMGLLDLPHLKVINQPAPSAPNSTSILVSSLNANQSVATSNRLLLIIASDALNSGQKFEDYRRLDQLTGQRGGLPILLKRTKVHVSLDNINYSMLKIYPLNPDGSRRAPIATAVSNGLLTSAIDTGALVGGPAVYFEIAP